MHAAIPFMWLIPPRVDVIKNAKYIAEISACDLPVLSYFERVLYKLSAVIDATTIDMMYQILMLLSQNGIMNKAWTAMLLSSYSEQMQVLYWQVVIQSTWIDLCPSRSSAKGWLR